MSLRVISGQSLLDIATQEDGNFETAFEWALLNKKSVTENLAPSEILISPNSTLKDKDIVEYFKGTQKKISTALTADQETVFNPVLGIGTMAIGTTFIVS